MSIIKQKDNNISKEMRVLRKKYAGFSVNKVVEEIEKHYNKHSYDEKILLNRIYKLETDLSFFSNLFGATLGTMLALIISPIEQMVKIVDSRSSMLGDVDKGKALLSVSIIVAVFLFFIVVIAVFMFFMIMILKKMQSFIYKSQGRLSYIDKKEIDIIKFIIENSYKKKRIKNRRCKSCRYKNRSRTYL